jgi:hypothetical protein
MKEIDYRKEYKYGELNLTEVVFVEKTPISYTSIPYGYIARLQEDPSRIFIFETLLDLENYFKGRQWKILK